MNFKHGKSKSPEYNSYCKMLSRCFNKNDRKYKNYGGRGISIDAAWLGENGFKNFFKFMGAKPSNTHSIDRINNDGNYGPENCRWATYSEQNSNRRSTKRIVFDGKNMTLSEWSIHLGFNKKYLSCAISRGYNAIDILKNGGTNDC